MRTMKRCALLAAAAMLTGTFMFSFAEGATAKVTIAGAGKGAGAFRIAGAIAEVVNKESKTVNMTNQETGGMVANSRMVANKRVEFALANGVFVDAIQRRLPPFDKERKAAVNLRGVGPVAVAWLQIAALADSGIKTMEDLKGKRVSLGPKGSNSVYMLNVVLDTLGIGDSIRKDFLKWEDAANYMVDGKLDAFGIPNPIPSPSILQASQSRPIRVLDVPDAVIAKFTSISKGYHKETVDMSVYQGMRGKKIKTVAYKVLLVAHDKVPADVVYEVTRQFYDPKNRDFILSVFRQLRSGLDDSRKGEFIGQMKSFGLKLHPGAARYWKEQNFSVN